VIRGKKRYAPANEQSAAAKIVPKYQEGSKGTRNVLSSQLDVLIVEKRQFDGDNFTIKSKKEGANRRAGRVPVEISDTSVA